MSFEEIGCEEITRRDEEGKGAPEDLTSASTEHLALAVEEQTSAIWREFKAAGIEIPYPQREVRVFKGAAIE